MQDPIVCSAEALTRNHHSVNVLPGLDRTTDEKMGERTVLQDSKLNINYTNDGGSD